MNRFYRFEVETNNSSVGIYEAVDRDCSRDDIRRQKKPDGSWLPKVGMDYPGAISFWSDYGLKKYIDSGLLMWHVSVINGQVFVQIINKPEKIMYEDEFQIICYPADIQVDSKVALNIFLQKH